MFSIHSHFKDKETGAERAEVICLELQSPKMVDVSVAGWQPC